MEILKLILEPAITLLVGSIAVGLYLWQKADKKRSAAQLVLQEIRYAESIIRNARTQAVGNYSLSDKLLPTNSWNENIHLFVKNLEESHLDLISRFYSQALYLDVVIRCISDWKCHQVITTPPTVSQSANTPQQLPNVPLQIPIDLLANQILMTVTMQIELVYNSPAVEKLIEISNKKFLKFF